jgi:Fe-S-cluster-containing hydrogenase component 2
MPVSIDTEKCGKIQNCPGEGLCIKICEKWALVEESGDVVLVRENCDDCDLCIQNCPNQAISKVQN